MTPPWSTGCFHLRRWCRKAGRCRFNLVHKELKSRKSVTLQLLWEEYREAHPEGFNYSWYCELYRQWARKLDIVMRQEHRAGEKTFADNAGQTVPVRLSLQRRHPGVKFLRG